MISNDSEQKDEFVRTMQTLLLNLKGNFTALVIEKPAMKANLLIDNAFATMGRLDSEDKAASLRLVKNELIPETGEAYVDLLFWGGCYPDSDAMFE